jgi:DNA-binding transcriptional ArsR family regulator
MNLSPVKLEILETLLMHDKPEKPAQVAKEIGKERPAVMMHLIGLARMGYAESPEKGSYIITEKGKVALGLPEVNKEKALVILTSTPHEKAFHFYAGIGKPLNIQAYDLLDFCDKIAKIHLDSVEFHLSRGDFEAWFTGRGDEELTKRIMLLKKKKTSGEELRKILREMVEVRCSGLTKMVGHGVPNK